MEELKKIFDEYMGNKEDSVEVVEKDDTFTIFAKGLKLEHEKYADLEQYNTDCSIAYEQQGFINGFRYAVKLLTAVL